MTPDKTQKNQTPTEQVAGTPDGLENKSLEPKADEVKQAKVAAATPAQEGDETPETVRVTMIHHGSNGDEQLVPGESYDLPTRTAQNLVASKRATLA